MSTGFASCLWFLWTLKTERIFLITSFLGYGIFLNNLTFRNIFVCFKNFNFNSKWSLLYIRKACIFLNRQTSAAPLWRVYSSNTVKWLMIIQQFQVIQNILQTSKKCENIYINPTKISVPNDIFTHTSSFSNNVSVSRPDAAVKRKI